MSWHHLYINQPGEASRLSAAARHEALALMSSSGNKEVAVFSRADKAQGGTHFYFSPAAARVARAHEAPTCDAPSAQEAGDLLFGDEFAVKHLLGQPGF